MLRYLAGSEILGRTSSLEESLGRQTTQEFLDSPTVLEGLLSMA